MASEGTNPGEVLGGKYRVERVIGRGGMGVVVAARHLALQQAVAIKLLPDDQAKDAESVARFLREARAVVRLKSEHAIKVTDVGRRKSGAPYFVMELLEGEDLDVLVGRGPLPVTDAVDFILQACEAVAEAHALGIIHRDLKPRNMFLTERRDGKRVVKVLDFGLAKPLSEYGTAGAALTATTAVLGSPQYMSPEQMRATRDVDFRTDVWSLGVCLYELLTRRMPFEADTVPVLCAMVLKDQPRPANHHRPEVPPALAAIIARCLEKDPSARFSNMQELATALEPFGSHESRGASRRIGIVLRAVAPPSLSPGNEAAFAHDGERTIAMRSAGVQGYVIAIASTLAVLGITGVVLIALYLSRTRAESPSASPSTGERSPARTASEKSPLVTESTPVRAVASGEPDEAAVTPAPLPANPNPPAVPVQGKTPPPAAPAPTNADPSRRF